MIFKDTPDGVWDETRRQTLCVLVSKTRSGSLSSLLLCLYYSQTPSGVFCVKNRAAVATGNRRPVLVLRCHHDTTRFYFQLK